MRIGASCENTLPQLRIFSHDGILLVGSQYRYFGNPIQLTMLLRWIADEPPKIGSASESRT